MKFTIVTPCRNAEALLGETMRSVLGQTALDTGVASLQYVICDGASTDGTLDIARSLATPEVIVDSVPDSGMYDALVRGLRQATGEWVGYVNAGDLLPARAFETIIDVVEQHPEVKWMTGIATRYDERGAVTHVSLPYRYRRSLMIAGQYTRRRPLFLPWIQQESTFWHTSLLPTVDFERLRTFRYAGDAYLWSCFAREADLHIVAAQLGGFRRHPGQLSEIKRRYKDEVRSFAPSPGFVDAVCGVIDHLCWYAPRRVKKVLNRDLMLWT